MSKFNIGDRVFSNCYGKYGVIEDKMYSEKMCDFMYTIQFDDSKVPFVKPLQEKDLEPICDNKEYRFEVFQAENVMVAVMYEIDGDTEREIKRYHGHIMHEGIIGIAQAASYAVKKIYIGMNDGKFVEREGI